MSHATRVLARRLNREHEAAQWKAESHGVVLFTCISLAVIAFSFAGWMFSLGGAGVAVGVAAILAFMMVMGRLASARASAGKS